MSWPWVAAMDDAERAKREAATWRNAVAELSREEREFLHRPLDEDDWLSALGSLGGKPPDSGKPLAKLLRTSTMPPEVQKLLAEYFDPTGPEHGRLVYEPTGLQQTVESLSLARAYHGEVDQRKERGERSPGRKAAVAVGMKIGRGWRTVSRKMQAWRNTAYAFRRYFYRH
jgi:hypothetical protein